ncbi:hypothetical protein BGZ73_001576, partial [Actinomortierella ambigua]
MDSYVLRMENLMTQLDVGPQWFVISRHYPDMSIGQFLQRCRALVHLDMSFPKGNINDPSAFAWAVDEARERAAGRLLAPPVPLESLNLTLELDTAEDVGRLLTDGLRGFAQSLRRLCLDLRPSRGNDLPRKPVIEDELFYGESVTMERLGVLHFHSADPKEFDYRLLQICPTLTHLLIDLRHHNDQYAPLPSWPIFDLPALEALTLDWTATELFDPASLHNTPKLHTLTLNYHRNFQTERTSPDRWTWDWDLPELASLDVIWYHSKSMFSLERLQSYPKLQLLSFRLAEAGDQQTYPLEIASVWASPSQNVYPNLRELHLQLNFNLQPEDLQ